MIPCCSGCFTVVFYLAIRIGFYRTGEIIEKPFFSVVDIIEEMFCRFEAVVRALFGAELFCLKRSSERGFLQF